MIFFKTFFVLNRGKIIDWIPRSEFFIPHAWPELLRNEKTRGDYPRRGVNQTTIVSPCHADDISTWAGLLQLQGSGAFGPPVWQTWIIEIWMCLLQAMYLCMCIVLEVSTQLFTTDYGCRKTWILHSPWQWLILTGIFACCIFSTPILALSMFF